MWSVDGAGRLNMVKRQIALLSQEGSGIAKRIPRGVVPEPHSCRLSALEPPRRFAPPLLTQEGNFLLRCPVAIASGREYPKVWADRLSCRRLQTNNRSALEALPRKTLPPSTADAKPDSRSPPWLINSANPRVLRHDTPNMPGRRYFCRGFPAADPIGLMG